MRKELKPFAVEVKRRPNNTSKKKFSVPLDVAPPPSTKKNSVFLEADSFFSQVKNDQAQENDFDSSQGRVLPCLVTEAALEEAKAADRAHLEAQALFEKRPVGRPRRVQAEESELAPLPKKTSAGTKKATAFKAPDDLFESKGEKRSEPLSSPSEFIEYNEMERHNSPALEAAEDDAVWTLADVENVSSPVVSRPPVSVFKKRQHKMVELPRGMRWKRRLPKIIW